MRNGWFRETHIRIVKTVIILSLLPVFVFSQINLHIKGLKQDLSKNWLWIPQKSNVTVFWEDSGGNGLIDNYQIKCFDFDNQIEKQSINVNVSPDQNFVSFPDLKLGERYSFVVNALNNGNIVAHSDTAKILTGRIYSAAQDGQNIPWYQKYNILSGRMPMSIIGRGYVFDNSTKAGKIAFHLIWLAFLMGVVIWWFFCWRVLSFRKIFPLTKNRILLGRSYQGMYKYVSKDFKEIVTKWRRLVELANNHVREGLKNGTHSKIEDIEMENIKFWRESGFRVVRTLLNRIKDPSLNLKDYPAVRIIHAGLVNHELGGFLWGEVSREVDRAIENRASIEIEQLRRRSLLDWLWNLGTLTPLVGLLGTATGISHAFAMLTMLPTNISQSEIVKRLAGGIFEALWTTILGLFVGIGLMLLYYFYQNKLNWIYAKWEDIYVNISESL